MRHESSLIKSLCCKAWRRSMTGVFVSPILSKPTGRVCQLACGTIARCLLFRGSASWRIGWNGAQKHILPHSGILKSASRSLTAFLFPDTRKGRQLILDAGGALLPKGPGANALRTSGASTARCSWKNRRYRRSWQCLPSGRRTSGADRPSLRRFRQVPSCAHSLLCELRRLRCRSNRLRP